LIIEWQESFPAGTTTNWKVAIQEKLVYKIKYGAKGELSSYKVQLIECGYIQVFGIDFDETFSHEIQITSMRQPFHHN